MTFNWRVYLRHLRVMMLIAFAIGLAFGFIGGIAVCYTIMSAIK